MKSLLKQMAEGLALAAALPLACAYGLLRAAFGDGCFAALSQFVSLVPGQSGVYFRRAVYRLILPECGRGCEIGFGTLLTSRASRLGPRVYVGPFSMLGEVTLEADVLIASHVSIINGGHQHGSERLDVPMRMQPGALPRVTIGAGSWIGERAVVMCDVGRGCIVGAGAVVTRPLPDYAVAAGVPAKIIRFRDENDSIAASDELAEASAA
jgi:acetyltransferase-like isoleucine patch superfamily enzyme